MLHTSIYRIGRARTTADHRNHSFLHDKSPARSSLRLRWLRHFLAPDHRSTTANRPRTTASGDRSGGTGGGA